MTTTTVRSLGVEPEKVEYVHPLSQLVLEHLQTTRGDWIRQKGLDRGLSLQRDGTFVLKFPSEDQSRIWYVLKKGCVHEESSSYCNILFIYVY